MAEIILKATFNFRKIKNSSEHKFWFKLHRKSLGGLLLKRRLYDSYDFPTFSITELCFRIRDQISSDYLNLTVSGKSTSYRIKGENIASKTFIGKFFENHTKKNFFQKKGKKNTALKIDRLDDIPSAKQIYTFKLLSFDFRSSNR